MEILRTTLVYTAVLGLPRAYAPLKARQRKPMSRTAEENRPTVPRTIRAARLLALLVTMLALAPPAAAAAASDDLAADPQSLERVPDRFRPLLRWWWPTDDVDPAELRTELRAMRRAGFGGVEQILLANVREWGTPTFRERTRTALQEADRLGLRFDITLGPGWPMSSPSVEDLSREASVQDLHYGAVDVDGGTTYAGPVPDRPPPASGRKRLIAATAIRVVGSGTPQALDPGSAVDLTSRVRNGALTWAVPPGRWKLFGFWMRPSLMRAKAPGGGSEGWLVPDHFSRNAIDLVLRDVDRMVFGGDMASLLRHHGGDVFEDSYEVEHGPVAAGQSAVFWTPTMPREFADRRGYAVTRLLPGLFGELTFPGDAGDRLKRDFDRTLNDLLIDNHLRPIRRWANRKGLRSREQAYQAGLGAVGTTENSHLAAAVQKPDVETLGFGDPNIGELVPVRPGSPMPGRSWTATGRSSRAPTSRARRRSRTSGGRSSTASSASAWRISGSWPTGPWPPASRAWRSTASPTGPTANSPAASARGRAGRAGARSVGERSSSRTPGTSAGRCGRPCRGSRTTSGAGARRSAVVARGSISRC